MDMSSCVLSHHPECDFRPELDNGTAVGERHSIVTYFCGNAIECRRLGEEGHPSIHFSGCFRDFPP